jgi:hypothetical protein
MPALSVFDNDHAAFDAARSVNQKARWLNFGVNKVEPHETAILDHVPANNVPNAIDFVRLVLPNHSCT